MFEVDARGLSCPQPVLMVKNALAKNEELYSVLVDNAVAAGNVTRFAENHGYSVSSVRQGDEFTLTLSKQ